ncbi:MAG: TGS domain-containing protein [Candidatus Krumholzibacteriia bacterium]
MPTNVSPEYKKAQEQYRRAREPQDRLRLLKEMLSTIPKHKGTEHVQADIKSKIKELTGELAGPRKGGARTGPVQVIKPEGAAQIAMLGPPNAGKSSLHRALTGSRAEVGPYPFTTQAPLPGMLFHQDVPFQLVDLPPISADFMEPWLPNALQPAHAALLTVDLHEPGCVEHVMAIRQRLDEKRIGISDDWGGRLAAGMAAAVLAPRVAPAGADDAGVAAARTAGPTTAEDGGVVGEPEVEAGGAAGSADDEDELEDPFRITLPTLLVVTKADLGVDPEEVAVLLELTGTRFPAVAVSAESDTGLDRLGYLLMRGLAVVRAYTKVPGKPADRDRPYTLFAGDTVEDLALQIHRELAGSFQFARVWGSAKFDGQQVGRDHVLRDGDVVEIHA